jgi:succinate dehydrogenase / fumarate reductase membrane anchor subunit
MAARPAPRIGFSFEYLMWIFTRISGLALYLLAFIGIVGAFYLGARTQVDIGALLRWTFFPNSNHVVNTEIPDLTLGWASAYWQVMQILVIFFAVTHGMNGLRVVLEDYIKDGWGKLLLRGLVFLLWLFMMIVAVYLSIAYG